MIYIISYSKTGRTWLRVLIGKSLCEIYNLPDEEIINISSKSGTAGMPHTVYSHDGSAMMDKKSYHELTADKSYYRDKKVLLLCRDVRDTLVSAYFQATKRINVFNSSISEFIRSEQYGAIKILTFYKHWYENKDIPKEFLFLRYEDLHKNAEIILQSILRFCGCQEVDNTIIKSAIAYASFSNLKRAEMKNRFNTNILAPKNIYDPESFKVRKGKVGNFSEYLSLDDVRYIDD